MAQPNIVIDTNVLIAALRSNRGWAFQVVSRIGKGDFDISLSIPLVLEYEEVMKRDAATLGLTPENIDRFLDYLCGVCRPATVYFQWQQSVDPDDDMVLELAVAAAANQIVTFNTRHFTAAPQFGIRVCTPGEFLAGLETPS